MRSNIKFSVWVTLFVVLLAGCATGCASIPDFKPSKPLRKASTFQEAINLCGEYQIAPEYNTLGQAEKALSISLVPWVRCFESVLMENEHAKNRQDYVAFYRALSHRYYSVKKRDTAVIEWQTFNSAVQTAVEYMANLDFRMEPVMPQESAVYWRSELPGFYSYLMDRATEVKREQKKTTRLQALTPPRPLHGSEKRYCQKWRAYEHLEHDLKKLKNYRNTLSKSHPTSALIQKIDERHAAKSAELTKSEKIMNQELHGIQRHVQWFKNGHCL